ncbi:MAG: MFS transporter [archaeon]|nr:MFS transporter [archaeon]
MEEYSTKILKGPLLISISIVLFLQTANSSTLGQIMPFFFKESFTLDCPPEYFLKDKGECDIKKMCKDKIEINLSDDSIKNWNSLFELYCESEKFIDKYFDLICQNLYFIGSAFFPVFMSGIPDKIGRMKCMNIEMVICLISSILLLIPNKFCIFVGMFINGGTVQIYSLVSQISAETYHQTIRGVVLGVFMGAIPIMCITHIIIFYFTRTTIYFFYYMVGSQVLSLILHNVLYIESPIWLMSQGDTDNCMHYLEKAAKLNGKEKEYEQFKEVHQDFIPSHFKEEEGQKVKGYTMIDVCRYKSVRKTVLKIIPSWMAILCFDFVVFLNLEKFGGDMYIQGISIFIACIISAFVSGFFADCFGRKITLIVCSVGAALPFIASPIFNQHKMEIPEMIVVFASCFFIESSFTVIVLIAGEAFPPTIRSNSNGLMYLFSRVGAIVAPYLVKLFQYPQYYASGFLLIMVIPMLFIPETLGLEVPTDVEENIDVNLRIKEEKIVRDSNTTSVDQSFEEVPNKEGNYNKVANEENIPVEDKKEENIIDHKEVEEQPNEIENNAGENNEVKVEESNPNENNL